MVTETTPRLRILAVALAALAAAGCVSSKPETTASMPLPWNERHPIVVAGGLETLDLVPGAGHGGINERQRGDLRSYASGWHEHGRGLLAIQLPRGGATDGQARHAVHEVRRELVGAGVPPRAIAVQAYAADGPHHLAPMRLAYPKLEARVASTCGQWPEDVFNGSDYKGNAENREYHNFGCAYQNNLAAQIADPEDLIRPRGETPPSAGRRDTVFGKYRAGENTATTAPSDTQSSSEVSR